MGIKLMVEIFDHWQDAGLTVGERGDLLVLAENANDGTRLTFGPVHAEYILRRAGKTANGWKNAIGKLVAKKVLTVHTPGRIKQAAVYRLEALCPEGRHDGYKGACRRSTERVTPEVTLSEKEGHLSDDPMGHPTGDPLGQEGHLTGVERVTSQVTPTPLYPSFKISSNTPSSSPAGPVESEPPVSPEPTTGGGGGSDLRSLAIHIADSLDYLGKPPTRKQRQVIEDRLLIWLEAGWSMYGLAVILDLTGQTVRHAPTVYALRLDPAEMPAPDTASAPAAARGGVRGPVPTAAEYEALTVADVLGDGRPAGPPVTWAEASANARERMAGVGARGGTDATVAGWDAVKRELAGHRPYSNPEDDSVYDEPWTIPAPPRPPWCGELECCETDRMREVEDDRGFKFAKPCEKCHPDRARAA